jgi:hypothetical protein
MNKFAIAIALLLATAAAAPADDVPAAFKTTTPVGSTPVPDPTLLTTQASEKAVAGLKELLNARIDGLDTSLKVLGAAIEKQEARTSLELDRIPKEVDDTVSHLQRLTEEKFKGVDQQFQGRDVALAAALLAQKTSVDEQNKANAASSAKAESATTKQIDGITSVIAASQKGTDDKIDAIKTLLISQKQAIDSNIADLKDRVAASDARAVAAATSIVGRSEGGASAWNVMVVGISVLFGLIGAIGMIVTVSRGQHQPRRS